MKEELTKEAQLVAYVERHQERTKQAIAEFHVARCTEIATEQGKHFTEGHANSIRSIVIAFPSANEMEVFAKLVIDVVRRERIGVRAALLSLLDRDGRKKLTDVYDLIREEIFTDLGEESL